MAQGVLRRAARHIIESTDSRHAVDYFASVASTMRAARVRFAVMQERVEKARRGAAKGADTARAARSCPRSPR